MDDGDLALAAARAGAEVIRDIGRVDRADFKGAVDPVTEADRAAETAILDLLRSRRPADEILAEESGLSSSGGSRRWLVDPLDGTVNFLHGVPHVGVSVALWDPDGPVAAAVIDVFRGEEFTAARDAGAHLNGAPMAVSETGDLSQALIATGFPYDRHQHAAAYAATLTAVLEQARGIRRLGTASLDFAYVAGGRVDAFWEFGLAPWDVAAGVLLVTEAGGAVSHHSGRPSRLGDRSYVVTNGRLHAQLQELVAGSVPDFIE